MTSKLHDVIYTLLYADTAVKAIVKDNIYPNMAPQGMKSTQPYLVYHVGNSKTETATVSSYAYFKIGVGAYGINYARVNTLIDAVKTKLHRHRGDVNGTFVNSIYYEEEGDGVIEAPQLHHRQAMFVVCLKL